MPRAHMPLWTAEELHKLEALLKDGATYARAAEQFEGRTAHMVRKISQETGLSRYNRYINRPMSKEDAAKIISLVESGLTNGAIQKAMPWLALSRVNNFISHKKLRFKSEEQKSREALELGAKIQARRASGQKFDDIARDLGMSAVTVQRRLQRFEEHQYVNGPVRNIRERVAVPPAILRLIRQGYAPAQIFSICEASDDPELRGLSRYDIGRMTGQCAKPARRGFVYKKTG